MQERATQRRHRKHRCWRSSCSGTVATCLIR
jgi:hypothetical protein